MKISLHPNESPALVEVRESNNISQLEIRVWEGGHLIPLEQWDRYTNRRVPQTTAAQVEMLAKLSCKMQKASPLHWSFLYLDHVARAAWLFRLQHAAGSRATELDGVPVHVINSALRNARQALGLERGPGAPRKRKP
jgi:hypothetical protein